MRVAALSRGQQVMAVGYESEGDRHLRPIDRVRRRWFNDADGPRSVLIEARGMHHDPEARMGTQMQKESATQTPGTRTVETTLEVVILPVADVERSKRFYGDLGWRLDADFSNGDWRAVQMTPPGSHCSVIFGKDFTTAAPGSVKGTFLVVDDLEAARTQLRERGADVGEVFHFEGPLRVSGTNGRAPGADPQGRSYSSWAEFSDPDGNTWLLQEIKTRLPGRGLSLDVATLTELMKEAEQRHGGYEATAPKHHWSDFYAAFVVARQQGRTSDEAYQDGVRNVEASLR
jgi:catechol 2,3-dioxygenase-like lactoylglutathione lyase family enzyme